jgi:hypothetical protein
MNKTLEALLRGYIRFDVNGKRFWKYSTALQERKSTDGDVEFAGFHILKGWRMFYLRRTLENVGAPLFRGVA